jgi:predicted dinucleotide-binding enzyme
MQPPSPAAIGGRPAPVRAAGHEPVIVGGLARARDFDYGTPVFGRPMTATELRKALGLKP